MSDRFTIHWKQIGTGYEFVTDYWYSGPRISGGKNAKEFMFNCCRAGRDKGFYPKAIKEGLFTSIEDFYKEN